VNGNSGDFISGGHILDFKIEKNFSKTIENLISVFIKKHYRLWNFLLTKNNEKIIKKLLLNEIIHTEIFKKINIYNSHSLIEYLEYYNRQSKHLSSKQRTYEYFNYEWAQPLWDKDYIEFWRVVKKKYKQKQNLYFETLKKDNFGDVWSDSKWFKLKESAKTTIPIFRFFLRPLAKFLFALKGKTAWHKFETRYMLYFTDILCSMGIKKYRDIINDNRGFRNFLSFHTEDYLNKKKIKINLLKFNK